VNRLVELLLERRDLDLVMLCHVTGNVAVSVAYSTTMRSEERRRRVSWFAQHVLGMQGDPVRTLAVPW
jgi:hypothetical protein